MQLGSIFLIKVMSKYLLSLKARATCACHILLVLLSSKHFDCKFFVIIFKVSFLENSDYNIYPLLGNWTIIIANTFATKSSSIADEPRI